MQEAPFALEEAVLFRSLTSGEIAFLREKVRLRVFKPAALLLECGQDSPGLCVIRSGLVAVIVRDDAGLERELASLGKGECVGEMALMTGEPCSATVRAVTDTEAWFIERGDFVDLVDRCPGLWCNLSRILSQRLVRTSRQLAARPSTSIVPLIMTCPEEEAAVLAVAITASLAFQTGRRTLLVDARGGTVRPASDFAAGKPAPSLSGVLHDPSLLTEHELVPDSTNGLSGARIAALCDEDGPRLTEEEILTALEGFRSIYDYILLLFPRLPAEPWPLLLDRARSIVTVVAEEEVASILPWLDHLSQSSEARGKAEVAIMGTGPLTSSVKQAIEDRVGSRVRRLPEDSSLLQQMLRQEGPFTEARPGSPLSRAVSRLARHIGEMEVGLALSAGGARGLAHVGVLRVLEENAVPIDYIAGCSIGAVVGGLYAGGMSPAEIERRLPEAYRKLIRWTVPFTSIWSDAGLRQVLRKAQPTAQFQHLAIPFAAIATDLASGHEVVLQDGLLWPAVQASVSVPGIFPPTVIAGRYLVDGGLVDPVPSHVVRAMGANIVVAVELTNSAARAERTASPLRGSAKPGGRAPNLVEMLWRSNEIMQGEITARSAATADVTIQPRLGRSRWSDFRHRGRSFVAAGEEAAKDALPELRRLLPFLVSSPGSGDSTH